MAAPETPTDLSIVDETQPAESPQSKAAGSAQEQTNSTNSRPGSRPDGASTETASPSRRGAPWWLVAVVAVVGLLLFGQQYQRAVGLDARITSLTEELLVADQRLQIAQSQIFAHQSHLERVRRGVAELTSSLAGLQALANQDPLAQPPVAEAEGNAVSSIAPESSQGSEGPSGPSAEASGSSASAEEVGSSSARSPQPNDGMPGSPVEDSRSIVHEIVGTPFSDL
ncbi:hypothetical protein MK280_12040 [Myxococcota bacterium]|nr:hypothetical protein [Myxococcota bacterium]